MAFGAQAFLDRSAASYNARDPDGMREFLDLSDPRFAVFEDFTGELIDGDGYSAMLEALFDATGRMSWVAPERLKKLYQERGLAEGLRVRMRDEKALEFLTSRAKVEATFGHLRLVVAGG